MTSAPADTTTPSAPVTAEDGAPAEDPLDAVMPLGLRTVFSLPGVSGSVRRWRYRGQSRVELIIVGVPTDQAGSQLRDQLLRVRAKVLAEFTTRGMYVFDTERKHDASRPRMTLIDRLK